MGRRRRKVQRGSHPKSLNYLLSNLSIIDEHKSRVKWIFKEGIWLKDDSPDIMSLCDLILFYESHAVPIELKQSDKTRNKAIEQLEQGKRFIDDILAGMNYKSKYGKIVYYINEMFEYEIYYFKKGNI